MYASGIAPAAPAPRIVAHRTAGPGPGAAPASTASTATPTRARAAGRRTIGFPSKSRSACGSDGPGAARGHSGCGPVAIDRGGLRMSEQPAVRVERSQKWVRTYAHGELVADTRRPLLVWERPHYPTYYIPVDDVRAKLVPTGETRPAERLGPAEVLTVVT